jgi:hypothetical protein
MSTAPITLTVNGSPRRFDGDPSMPLLWFLRDELALTGTKYGCGISQCGACTVHLDGRPVKACAVLAIVGAINVPIIKYSVDWWNTLHQPASNFSMDPVAPNPPEVWVPLLVMICAVYVFFAIALILRTRNEILQRERRSQWVIDLVAREKNV